MPFSYKDFKAACHQRAMTPAILAMGVEPLVATVVTEHNASFPRRDSQECYISVVVGAKGRTFEAIRYAKSFSLNVLNETHMDVAKHIYAGDLSCVDWSEIYNVPYIKGTNTIICSLLKSPLPLGPNQLVTGHVMHVIADEELTPPLVNYRETYCKIDGTRVPATDPAVHNTRFMDGEDKQ